MKNAFATITGIWVGLISAVWADDLPLQWVEGENATRSNTHRNAWFDAVDPTELSGGAQIASFSESNQPGGWAEYDVTVPAGGKYRFWLRANPASGLLYAVNGSGWVKLDTDAMAKEDQARHARKDT